MSPKICYVEKNFKLASMEIIAKAREIIEEYSRQGFTLTLRQLYYQFVARGIIENSQRSYKRLGSIVNDGRLAGLIDWDSIEDRTRSLRALPHWSDPGDVISSAASGYQTDLWRGQKERVEVWIEKDALVGVIERVCREWDVPYFSCRGYVSQSELWSAAMRHKRHGCATMVLHLGDHDPSGIDMTRDIQDRLDLFGAGTHVDRIALSMAQVEENSPPPNPAKMTDSRFESYVAEYGDESWELDALSPQILHDLIDSNIEAIVDRDLWGERKAEMESERKRLNEAATRWDEVEDFLAG